MIDMLPETIDKAKAGLILQELITITEGPREAYALLCLAIYILNFEIIDNPTEIDQLADEVAHSLRSIRRHGTQ